MNDSDFDVLMRRAGVAPAVAPGAIDELVTQSRRRAHRRLRDRRPVVVVGLVGGALAMAAAASTSAVMLQHAPFQTIEDGAYRTSASIPVDYTSLSGHTNYCLAFLEFQHLDAREARQANDFVHEHDWSGLGQRAYDHAVATVEQDPAQARTTGDGSQVSVEDAITGVMADDLDDELHAATVAALPVASSEGESSDPAWSGSSMSCAGGQR